jgi:hypothetical protein
VDGLGENDVSGEVGSVGSQDEFANVGLVAIPFGHLLFLTDLLLATSSLGCDADVVQIHPLNHQQADYRVVTQVLPRIGKLDQDEGVNGPAPGAPAVHAGASLIVVLGVVQLDFQRPRRPCC